MGFFRKKVEEEDEYEDVERPRRKIRDLRPENKKTRKEPVKPWGKFERLTVLITLLFTVVAAIVLTLYAAGFRLPNMNFDFSRFNIFEEQTIIIEDI